jgi:hypothetical protein
MILAVLNNTLGKFEGSYKESEIEDAITEFYSQSLQTRVKRGHEARASIAEVLNSLCSMIKWVKEYCDFHDFLEPNDIDNAIKMALFNFNLGEAPQHGVILSREVRHFLKQAETVDPHSKIPYLPEGVDAVEK